MQVIHSWISKCHIYLCPCCLCYPPPPKAQTYIKEVSGGVVCMCPSLIPKGSLCKQESPQNLIGFWKPWGKDADCLRFFFIETVCYFYQITSQQDDCTEWPGPAMTLFLCTEEQWAHQSLTSWSGISDDSVLPRMTAVKYVQQRAVLARWYPPVSRKECQVRKRQKDRQSWREWVTSRNILVQTLPNPNTKPFLTLWLTLTVTPLKHYASLS